MSEVLTEPVAQDAAAPEAAPAATSDALANAAPVAPEAPAEATPAVADQAAIDAASEAAPAAEAPAETPAEQPQEPAAAEQAPTDPDGPISAKTGLPAEPLKAKIQEPTHAPADADPSDLDPNETQIDMAKRWVIGNRKSSAAALQQASKLPMETVEKILAKLEEMKILGPAKEDGSPRDILVEAPKPAMKISVSQTPKKTFKKERRPVMSDAERVANWAKHLKEIGKLDDDNLIKQVTDYALKNQGFNPHAKWGSCLIVMINRFLNRLRDSLRTFTQSDADFLCRELLRFASEQPLGDGVMIWNSKYRDNLDQKDAVSDFFGINCSFRDLRGSQRICLTAIRDAAWPTKMEEKNGTGGTYAERFHYLALAIVTFGSGDYSTELFRNCIHHEPTEAFLERINGGRPVEKTPSWIKDGKCIECDSEVVKDSAGNDVCSNPICPNHFAKVSQGMPKSFRSGGNRGGFRQNKEGFDPNSVPVAPTPDQAARRNKRNWKKRRDNGDDDGGDGLPKFQKKRPKGQRWRENHDDDGLGGGDNGVESAPTVSTVGGDFKPTIGDAFAGLEIPTVSPEPAAEAAPAEAANLPEPPPEVPVV